ncbi:AAA family ATPase [Microcoleus sp. CAWBG640]|uniref:AAA family ATPase n=1 Tax=Microcoleus sp. CAWBG640 TaxID=2841653 RepID=UPI00312B570E
MTEKIISMFNNKGGVGKTTILWNLGVSLAAAGKKTLLIDFDPQCNLSIATIGYEEFAKYNVPIKYLSTKRPTRDAIKSGAWTYSQSNLMKNMDKEYDSLAKYIIKNF